MLFYKFQMNCYCARSSIGGELPEDRRTWRMQLGDLSAALSEGIDGDKIRVFIHRARQNYYQCLVSVDGFKELTTATLTATFEKFFSEHDEFHIRNIKIEDLEEITTSKFSKIFDRANRSDNFNFDYYQINQDLGLDCWRAGENHKKVEPHKFCAALRWESRGFFSCQRGLRVQISYP